MVNSNISPEPTRSPEDYRSARKALGLTMSDLAGILGVSSQTIANRENGRSAITAEAWFALECIYNHAVANANRENIDRLKDTLERYRDEARLAEGMTHTSDAMDSAWNALNTLMESANMKAMPTPQELVEMNELLDRFEAARLEVVAELNLAKA